MFGQGGSRQLADLLPRHAALDRGRLFVDQRRLGGDGDVLGDRADAEFAVDGNVLPEDHVRGPGHRLHAGEREHDRVLARNERRHPVLAARISRRDAGLRQDVGLRLDGDAGKERAIARLNLAVNRARLLGKRRDGDNDEREH